jgi:hypothetical protein
MKAIKLFFIHIIIFFKEGLVSITTFFVDIIKVVLSCLTHQIERIVYFIELLCLSFSISIWFSEWLKFNLFIFVYNRFRELFDYLGILANFGYFNRFFINRAKILVSKLLSSFFHKLEILFI